MADGFTKQIAEEFTISAQFSNALETGESIDVSNSSVTAEDLNGDDATDSVLTSSSKTVDGTKLKVRVEGGTVTLSPYKITFLITTNLNNIYELDVFMTVADY